MNIHSWSSAPPAARRGKTGGRVQVVSLMRLVNACGLHPLPFPAAAWRSMKTAPPRPPVRVILH